MVKQGIGLLLNILAVGGGIFAGQFVLVSPPPSDTSQGEEVSDASDEAPAKEKADVYPIRFARPFVVPVTDGWRTNALVVVSLSAEIERGAVDGVIGLEERLRDRIMQRLIAFSYDGGFNGAINDPSLYDTVREQVKDALAGLYPEKIGDVMVLEMLKRSV